MTVRSFMPPASNVRYCSRCPRWARMKPRPIRTGKWSWRWMWVCPHCNYRRFP